MASIQPRIRINSPIPRDVYNQLTEPQKKKCKFVEGKIYYSDHFPNKLLPILPARSRKEVKYYVHYRDKNGVQKISPPFKNKQLSEKFKKRIEHDLEFSRVATPIKNMKVEEGIVKYLNSLKHLGRTKSTIERAGQMLNKLLLFCKEKNISFLNQITLEHMEEYKSWNRNMKPHLVRKNIPVNPRTLRDEFIRFQNFYKYAKQFNWMLENPFQQISDSSNSSNNILYRPYTDGELQIILYHSDSFWRRIWTFFFYTGVRLSELRFLQLKDLDIEKKLIHIRNKPELGYSTKNKLGRVIPMNSAVESVLKEIVHERRLSKTHTPKGRIKKNPESYDESEFVFLSSNLTQLRNKNIYDKLSATLKRTNLSRSRPVHQFRHSFGTRLAQTGASGIQIAELMGHKDTKTTDIYIHMTGADLHAIVDRL
jgi:site-specific recombinase XerD